MTWARSARLNLFILILCVTAVTACLSQLLAMRKRKLGRSNIDGLDPGIAAAVRVLRNEGVETVQSCEGGSGHSFPEPTVRFDGDRAEGYRALEIILRRRRIGQLELRPRQLRRVWDIVDGELVGPLWELTWWSPAYLRSLDSSPAPSCHDEDART